MERGYLFLASFPEAESFFFRVLSPVKRLPGARRDTPMTPFPGGAQGRATPGSPALPLDRQQGNTATDQAGGSRHRPKGRVLLTIRGASTVPGVT